jgi:predicted KAP-like P-loop ATPase
MLQGCDGRKAAKPEYSRVRVVTLGSEAGMMISPDAPIKHVKDDKLGRAPFARALAKTLLANAADESFVVGVHGKWGTGKSSVLNLCVEELRTQAKDSPQELDIIHFNPWNFADQDQVVLQFFRQLTAHLRNLDPKGVGKIKNLIESLDAYATTLGPPFEAIPYGKTLWTGWRAGIGVMRRALGMGQDVDSLYSSISNQLQDLKRKIVVVIDDVDRLTAAEIRQVFQLVKISARFPYVIYLVAFDRTAVASALKDLGVGSGEEYLEKIVQVSFDLPPISGAALTKIILESISALIHKYSPAKMDTARFGNVFHAGIRDSFDSLRDVQRFLNGLEFGFGMVAKEVNGIDFIALECLRIFYPSIFEAVRNNKKIFAGHIDAFEKDRGSGEYRKTVESVLTDETNLEKTKDLLIELFPKLRYAYGNTLYPGDAEEDWERNLRIASTRYFDLYFQLVVSSEDVSTSEVDMMVSKASDWAALEELLASYIGSKRIVNALSSFRHSLGDIKPGFLPNVLHNFWCVPVFCDPTSHADLLVSILFLGCSKFLAALSPDHNREDLARIRLVKVQKCRLATTRCRVACARHLAANCGLLSDVVFGLGSGQPLNLRSLGNHIIRRKG